MRPKPKDQELFIYFCGLMYGIGANIGIELFLKTWLTSLLSLIPLLLISCIECKKVANKYMQKVGWEPCNKHTTFKKNPVDI